MIEARGLVVRRAGRDLVAGISFTLRAGEFLGVLGPNGAGKSTLLRALAGEFPPDRGAATLDGKALAAWDRGDLARRRAVLPQQSAVAFEIAARGVVELGRLPHEGHADRAANARAVERALAACGAAHLAARNYAELSGGEQQRVQLARALAQIEGAARPVLLLDEPTASLDLAHQHAVLALANRVARRGGSVLAVLHDPFATSLHCDRIAVLDGGRLVALGPPAEALTPDLVRRVFAMESRWIDLPGERRALTAFPATA